MSKERVKTFTAELRPDTSNLGWKVIDIPFDVKKVFGRGTRLPVCGTVNGFAFRTSLFPIGEGRHMMLINKQVQKGAGGVTIGDKVKVTLQLDEEERMVELPKVLRDAFEGDKDLLKYYDSQTYSMRKYIVDYIL